MRHLAFDISMSSVSNCELCSVKYDRRYHPQNNSGKHNDRQAGPHRWKVNNDTGYPRVGSGDWQPLKTWIELRKHTSRYPTQSRNTISTTFGRCLFLYYIVQLWCHVSCIRDFNSLPEENTTLKSWTITNGTILRPTYVISSSQFDISLEFINVW